MLSQLRSWWGWAWILVLLLVSIGRAQNADHRNAASPLSHEGVDGSAAAVVEPRPPASPPAAPLILTAVQEPVIPGEPDDGSSQASEKLATSEETDSALRVAADQDTNVSTPRFAASLVAAGA